MLLFIPLFAFLLSFYLCAYLLGFAFVALCLYSLLALFVLVSLWVLLLFPFRTASDVKRKGAKVLLLASSLRVLCVVVMRLLIARGLPAIPFRLLRDSVRNCSIVGGSRQNISNLMR